MRVLPALMQRSLSPSSRKTDIKACIMPIVDARSSGSCSMERLKVREGHNWLGLQVRINDRMPCEHRLASVGEDEVLPWRERVR
jgi:hypothetical protein